MLGHRAAALRVHAMANRTMGFVQSGTFDRVNALILRQCQSAREHEQQGNPNATHRTTSVGPHGATIYVICCLGTLTTTWNLLRRLSASPASASAPTGSSARLDAAVWARST